MEKKKQADVWMVYLESNVDGEILFESVPCSTLKRAREVLKNEKIWVLNESHHYSQFTPQELEEVFIIEESEDKFFINDPTDDYWEDYKIVRKKILT